MSNPFKNWKPVDYIVGMMAVCISSVVIVMPVTVMVLKVDENEARVKLFATVLSSVIAIITLYVGAQLQRGVDEHSRKEKEKGSKEGEEKALKDMGTKKGEPEKPTPPEERPKD